MARNKTLLQLTDSLRAETRRSSNASRGIDDLAYLHQVLRRTQEVLYDDYDWSFLKIERQIIMNAGQYLYDFPVDLNYERIIDEGVWYSYSESNIPLDFGINPGDYTTYDSKKDERSDPILKWDIIHTGVKEQLEVWPVPVSTGKITFEGILKLPTLIANDDVAILDDLMIVLFSASEVLADAGQKGSDAKLRAAQKRYNSMRVRTSKGGRLSLAGNPVPTSRDQRALRYKYIAR